MATVAAIGSTRHAIGLTLDPHAVGQIGQLLTCRPRIFRQPSAFTPTASTAWTFTVRPTSRTFGTSTSAARNVSGPATLSSLMSRHPCVPGEDVAGLGESGDSSAEHKLLVDDQRGGG